MTFDKMIKEALDKKLTKSQGNYQVTYDKQTDKSQVFMFGNKIFDYDHKNRMSDFDFCGYEGHPRTTKAINYCLAAVEAPYRVKTELGNVIKVWNVNKVFKV